MTKHVILTAGDFGEAVAAYAGLFGDSIIQPLSKNLDENAAVMANAATVSVAVWRPHDDALLQIDDFCHQHGIRVSFATLRGSRLCLGPLVIPTAKPGGCYHCFLKRWGAHAASPEHERVLRSAYLQNWDLGVAGYITPLVAIAASTLSEDRSAAAAEAGRVRIVGVLGGDVLQTKVIPVHACPRCRPGATEDEPGQRFVRHIVPALTEVMAWPQS